VLSELVAQDVSDGASKDVLVRATQAELAQLAGSSRESASRFLAVLERAGVISQGRGRLVVHDLQALKQYAFKGAGRAAPARARRTIPKSVCFVLFAYRAGDIADHDPEEVQEVRWMELAEAQLTLSHAAEREMVALAISYLEEGRKDR